MLRHIPLILFFLGVVPSCLADDHNAGETWAYEQGIEDPNDCYNAMPGLWSGNFIDSTESFTDGCLAYLRDHQITNFNDDVEESDDSEEDSESEGF